MFLNPFFILGALQFHESSYFIHISSLWASISCTGTTALHRGIDSLVPIAAQLLCQIDSMSCSMSQWFQGCVMTVMCEYRLIGILCLIFGSPSQYRLFNVGSVLTFPQDFDSLGDRPVLAFHQQAFNLLPKPRPRQSRVWGWKDWKPQLEITAWTRHHRPLLQNPGQVWLVQVVVPSFEESRLASSRAGFQKCSTRIHEDLWFIWRFICYDFNFNHTLSVVKFLNFVHHISTLVKIWKRLPCGPSSTCLQNFCQASHFMSALAKLAFTELDAAHTWLWSSASWTSSCSYFIFHWPRHLLRPQ